jgi:hypothetical protein
MRVRAHDMQQAADYPGRVAVVVTRPVTALVFVTAHVTGTRPLVVTALVGVTRPVVVTALVGVTRPVVVTTFLIVTVRMAVIVV